MGGWRWISALWRFAPKLICVATACAAIFAALENPDFPVHTLHWDASDGRRFREYMGQRTSSTSAPQAKSVMECAANRFQPGQCR